ncbi:MAG: redoxin domain-containing protein [Saprospiraceae bacterium]
MTIKNGDKAPTFVLRASDLSEISLTDFNNKNVVILFFPLAFTGVCTAELCSMRDDIATYEGLNAEILAISVDSPFVLAKFKEEQKLNFTLLSDFNKEVSRAYGALYEDFVLGLKEVSKRAAFVLDKNGVIRYAEVLENAQNLPTFSAVKETLDQLN